MQAIYKFVMKKLMGESVILFTLISGPMRISVILPSLEAGMNENKFTILLNPVFEVDADYQSCV